MAYGNTVNSVDLSTVAYLGPVWSFVIVFVVVFAILMKSKLLGEEKLVQILASFVIATIFVSTASINELVLMIIPWFAVLLIVLFCIMMFAGFIGKTEDIAGKGLGWTFVVLLGIVFLISIIKVFSISIFPYLPGPAFGARGDPELLFFLSWIYSPGISGALILGIVAAIVFFVLVKYTGKK